MCPAIVSSQSHSSFFCTQKQPHCERNWIFMFHSLMGVDDITWDLNASCLNLNLCALMVLSVCHMYFLICFLIGFAFGGRAPGPPLPQPLPNLPHRRRFHISRYSPRQVSCYFFECFKTLLSLCKGFHDQLEYSLQIPHILNACPHQGPPN